MAAQEAPSLSRFFRMAAVAGVESAVQVHIDRGDDLNARDNNGQTPLMLSAARNKASICQLLLAAGADAGLTDPLGRSALVIAQAAGALEAASVIAAGCVSQRSSVGGDDYGVLSHVVPDEQGGPVADDAQIIRVVEVDFEQPVIARFASDDDGGLDLSGWEAELDQQPPEGDPALSRAAFEIQSAITEHQPIDTSANWDDFEAFLPDRAAPLPRADDVEARERLRLILLRAIREGSVPRSAIEALTRGDDGEPDAEAGSLLGMVINDLGAEMDERFEYSAPHENFTVFIAPEEAPGEEEMIAEALAFVDDLATRHNEPLRIYQREFQREALLTAEAEVVLGQAMERCVEEALDVLAGWPSGIMAVLDAAKEVMSGAKSLRWLASAPQVQVADVESTPSDGANAESDLPTDANATGVEDEGDSGFGLDAKESMDEMAEFSASVGVLSGLVAGKSQEDAEWDACRSALASLGLTRSFLLQLADGCSVGEAESAVAFAQAIKGYRRARDQMTVANLKLVFSIAKKYLFSGQPLDDLLQEGNIGLLKAVDRYDWRRGFKFSTYATWWIRQQVGRHVADKSKTIRLPVHVYEKTQRIAQSAYAFELRLGHAPTLEELAELVELPMHKLVALTRASLEPLPLHEVHDLDELLALDAREQFTIRDPMEIVEDMQLIASVDRFLSTLKLKEENILRLRFGIGVQESMTLEEVGARLDVTRERIRQIEAAALRKLKNPARLDRLLHELNGAAPPKLDARAVGSTDDEADDNPPLAADSSSQSTRQAIPRPERLSSSEHTALEKLLDHARARGITVEDFLDGVDRRIWVHIKEAPDNHSRKIVRKLIDLGFEFWPGKGYWR